MWQQRRQRQQQTDTTDHFTPAVQARGVIIIPVASYKRIAIFDSVAIRFCCSCLCVLAIEKQSDIVSLDHLESFEAA